MLTPSHLWGIAMNNPLLVSVLATGVILLVGCNPAPVDAPNELKAPETRITAVSPGDVPAEVLAAVLSERPGMVVTGAELKERQGRRYFDVEGLHVGTEIELDLLETPEGWRVVEIQRDIAWSEVPAVVASEATAARAGFIPVRIIESVQASDDFVIYELFAEGQAETPALEVRLADGKAERLKEAWPH